MMLTESSPACLSKVDLDITFWLGHWNIVEDVDTDPPAQEW